MDNNVKEVQDRCLELLKIFAEVCDKNGLEYFIIGGTLLGAVRHGGFIPWDDDIDVAMPRKDYEFLIKNADKLFEEPYFIRHFSRCGSANAMKDMIAKMCSRDYAVYFRRNDKVVKRYAGIDVMPIDGTPDNSFIRRVHYFRLMAMRAIFKFTFSSGLEINNGNKRSFIEKILIVFAKTTNIGRFIDRRKTLERLENTLKKYDMHKSGEYAGTFLGAYMLREFTKRKYFTKRRKYRFEDGEFYGTAFYDEYLTSIYGDYMKLPPESERRGKHKIIKVEKIK